MSLCGKPSVTPAVSLLPSGECAGYGRCKDNAKLFKPQGSWKNLAWIFEPLDKLREVARFARVAKSDNFSPRVVRALAAYSMASSLAKASLLVPPDEQLISWQAHCAIWASSAKACSPLPMVSRARCATTIRL
ncbi:hypothetical protein Efla_003917 [Eimeria flavescens]